MRFISTKVHGYMDYTMGLLLIASPWIFGFADDGGMKLWVPMILGMGAILYSLMTDYELGLSDNISMRTHLGVDLLSGILLAASPWIFGFADVVYMPHLILGVIEIGAALMTRTHPATENTKHKRESSFMDSHRTARGHRTAHG